MPTSDIIDRVALSNLLENISGDMEFFSELMDSYFLDSPRLLAEARRAITADQPAALQLAVHSLKSTSANFGALHLAALCREMESIGRAGSVAGASELLLQAEAEYARVHDALEAIRATGA